MAEIICLAQIGLPKTLRSPINTLECFLLFMVKVGDFLLEKKKKNPEV